MTKEKMKREMVRDFSQVHPTPKSEIRRRINELLLKQRKDLLDWCEKNITSHPRKGLGEQYLMGWNNAQSKTLSDLKEKLK